MRRSAAFTPSKRQIAPLPETGMPEAGRIYAARLGGGRGRITAIARSTANSVACPTLTVGAIKE